MEITCPDIIQAKLEIHIYSQLKQFQKSFMQKICFVNALYETNQIK